jgi:7-cyano-7-deazaguanine reductase
MIKISGMIDMIEENLQSAPLGKKSQYICEYDPSLLFPIPRQGKRDEIQVPTPLPFYGFDTWNAFELSWLNAKGKPQVAVARFDIAANSENIIESKSFKLYLNSFNNTRIATLKELKETLARDIEKNAQGDVTVEIYDVDDCSCFQLASFDGETLDDLDVECDQYIVNPDFLKADENLEVTESLYSNLLKSNCLVTGQPDWGSVEITYQGPKIDREGLLKYLVSFRNHNEFHEQCVERIFMDIMTRCQPQSLTVNARYTRRGGLDINPIRSTENIGPAKNIRMSRQ